MGALNRTSERLQLSASVAAIRDRVNGSGTDAYDGHQSINVPKWRAIPSADYLFFGAPRTARLSATVNS